MNLLKRLLRQVLKRLLKQFEDQLNIFILTESILMPFKEEMSSETWQKLMNLPQQKYLTGNLLSKQLEHTLGKNSSIKASIFQNAIDPHRLFNLEFQDQKNGKDGPIGSIVRVICRHYNVRESDVEDWVQQICTKLSEDNFHKLRSYQGNSSFLTYLMTVIEHLCIDEARGRWGRKEIPEEIKEMGALASQLYVLLYWEEKSLHEAYEQLKLESDAGQYEDSRSSNFSSKIHLLAMVLAERLEKVPNLGKRHLEFAFSQSNLTRIGEENLADPENLSADVKTPEEELLIQDTLIHFKEHLYHSEALSTYKLTHTALETFKLGMEESLWIKLKPLVSEEYEKEKEFIHALEQTIGSEATHQFQSMILQAAFCVPPQFILFLKRIEAGDSIPKIAEDLEMPLNALYSRINKLKAEMMSKGWEKAIIDQFFKR